MAKHILEKGIKDNLVKTWAGTPIYMSPEMIKFRYNNKINITFKTDVWSIGCVMYELLTLKRPFKTRNEIKNLKPPSLDSALKEDVPDLFKTLIMNKILIKNPIQRISSLELKMKLINWVIQYSANGRYEGDWVNENANGKGIFYYLSGSKYDGDWLNGKMNGKGIYYYSNGNKYVGSWLSNKRNGEGIFYHSNGDRFVGEWKMDFKHGKGVMFFAHNNSFVKQNWKNGKIIQ